MLKLKTLLNESTIILKSINDIPIPEIQKILNKYFKNNIEKIESSKSDAMNMTRIDLFIYLKGNVFINPNMLRFLQTLKGGFEGFKYDGNNLFLWLFYRG